MSKELELIAEHAFGEWGWRMRDDGWIMWFSCNCGRNDVATTQKSEGAETHVRRLRAAHVLAKLSEHGYSIVHTSETRMHVVREEDSWKAVKQRVIEESGSRCCGTCDAIERDRVARAAAAAEEDQ